MNEKKCDCSIEKKCMLKNFYREEAPLLVKVKTAKMKKTVVVEYFIQRNVPKYERKIQIKKTKKAHLRECILVKEGDRVYIQKFRKLSKHKSHIVTAKI